MSAENEATKECPTCGQEVPDLMLRDLKVEDGVLKMHFAPHAGLKNLITSFQETLAEAPNYVEAQFETRWSFRDAGSDDVYRVCAAVVRPKQKSPHEFRLAAEARIVSALAVIDVMGDGVSPECCDFAEQLRRALGAIEEAQG